MFLNECRTRTACTFVATAQSADRQWVAAAAGDVDGDGRRDLIAFARGAAHVDVLLGTATRGTFNDARIVAPGTVEAVRVGDFDGNALTDVAFVASTADRDTDALYVAFGRGNAAPAAPTYMGYLGNLLASIASARRSPAARTPSTTSCSPPSAAAPAAPRRCSARPASAWSAREPTAR